MITGSLFTIGFFTKSTVIFGTGGIANAIVGTLVIVGLATAVALPFGVLVAIYTNDGQALPCDAGTLLACVKGPGKNLPGMTTFTNVPQGRYWVVIGADAPDVAGNQSSGSVNIAVSGMPH